MGRDALVRYRSTVWNNDRWQTFSARAGDIIISSPPKCGTTWMQMICALLIFQRTTFERPLDLIPMTKEELAAADISRFPKAGTGSGSGTGTSEGDSEVVGHGPNGDVLYAADWARKPTNAELGGYLPPNAPDGYGLVACKTLPQNRVDDCVELESRPRGSHLASAVRQAAWQFRVRPPRKNGRDLVGEWVKIQIFYTHSEVRIE